MQISKSIGVGVPVMCMVFAASGYWLYTHRAPLRESVAKQQDAAVPTATQAQNPTRFYLSLDPYNPAAWEDDNGEITTYESCNSLGVNEKVAADFPDLLPDFIFIGDQNAAREQFLADQNFVFENPQHFYKTLIGTPRNVGNEIRILSLVFVGHDGLRPGITGRMSVGMKTEVTLSEIWRVDPKGGEPQLLERIRCGEHDGFIWEHDLDFLTTVESPPRPVSDIMGGP